MADRRPPPRPGNNPPRRGSQPGGPKARGTRPGGPKAAGARPAGPAQRPPNRRPANHSAPGQNRGRQNVPPRVRDHEGDVEGGLERLQKVLAHAGVSSRRACEELILQGRVTVDGQVVRELGTRIDPRKQQVAVDGQKVLAERNVYYAVHKPKGYVSSNHDPAGKPLVVNLLPEIPQRVYAVGRLDEQSTGLMLLTNDGELANKLAHPKFGVEKIYRVVVAGEPGREILDQLTQGIWLAEGKVRAKRVRITGHKGQATVLEMVLAEGKNREIRRMLAKLGHKVMSLTRIAVGPIGLKGIAVGECRPLTAREVDMLRKVASGLLVPTPRFPDRRDRVPRPEGNRPPRPSAQTSEGPAPGRPNARVGSDRPRPRPEGRGPSGPGRPSRPPINQAPRPMQGQGQGQRPPINQTPRPMQGQGQSQRPPINQTPRPMQGQSQGQRPPINQTPRPMQGQSQGQRPGQQGPARKPPTGQGPGPVRRPTKPPMSQRDDGPTRRVIGLESEPAPHRGGPTGPRLHRPGPKRSPRAALGIKRPPKPDKGTEE